LSLGAPSELLVGFLEICESTLLDNDLISHSKFLGKNFLIIWSLTILRESACLVSFSSIPHTSARLVPPTNVILVKVKRRIAQKAAILFSRIINQFRHIDAAEGKDALVAGVKFFVVLKD